MKKILILLFCTFAVHFLVKAQTDTEPTVEREGNSFEIDDKGNFKTGVNGPMSVQATKPPANTVFVTIGTKTVNKGMKGTSNIFAYTPVSIKQGNKVIDGWCRMTLLPNNNVSIALSSNLANNATIKNSFLADNAINAMTFEETQDKPTNVVTPTGTSWQIIGSKICVTYINRKWRFKFRVCYARRK